MPSPSTAGSGVVRLLVFEPDPEGHSEEWLQHLIEYGAANAGAVNLSIVAPLAVCRALELAIPAGGERVVDLLPLTPLEARACTLRVLSLAALARSWAMQRHLRRTAADCGLFLSLDLLCLPLAIGLGRRGKRLTGILFRPSVHYNDKGASFRERLRDWRKDVLYRLMLRNPALASILSLDPFFPAHAAANYRYGHKVTQIVDPASGPMMDALPAGGGGTRERIRFLLFGYLTERKGTLRVLQALEGLPNRIAARLHVELAGRIDPAIVNSVEGQRRHLVGLQPDLRVHVENRRLDRAELEARVQQCDVVLVPYQRFVGSSGVMLWAARAGRPVLAQEYGLVGRLTRDNGLGLTADTSDPVALTEAMIRMVEEGPRTFVDQSAARAFVGARSAQRFAATVFAAARADGDKETMRQRNLVTVHRND